jgi:hypothetical protein
VKHDGCLLSALRRPRAAQRQAQVHRQKSVRTSDAFASGLTSTAGAPITVPVPASTYPTFDTPARHPIEMANGPLSSASVAAVPSTGMPSR